MPAGDRGRDRPDPVVLHSGQPQDARRLILSFGKSHPSRKRRATRRPTRAPRVRAGLLKIRAGRYPERFPVGGKSPGGGRRSLRAPSRSLNPHRSLLKRPALSIRPALPGPPGLRIRALWIHGPAGEGRNFQAARPPLLRAERIFGKKRGLSPDREAGTRGRTARCCGKRPRRFPSTRPSRGAETAPRPPRIPWKEHA
jgi:hypothetical protein